MSTARCGRCHGGELQHTLDAEEGCWCPRCLLADAENRCQQWVEPAPVEAVDRNVTRVSRGHPDTAQHAAVKALPRSGTTRAHVYRQIVTSQGMTCDEIEWALTKSHQSVSAAVNTLMNDDLITDSGMRRLTRLGYPAIVWTVP